jgi:hypothetical protein
MVSMFRPGALMDAMINPAEPVLRDAHLASRRAILFRNLLDRVAGQEPQLPDDLTWCIPL